MPSTTFATNAYAATRNLMATGAGAVGAAPGIGAAKGGGTDFGSMLQSVVNGVAESGKTAESQAMAVASGKADVVDVVTAVAESEAALDTLVAVRDRVISAYQEIMRMQI